MCSMYREHSFISWEEGKGFLLGIWSMEKNLQIWSHGDFYRGRRENFLITKSKRSFCQHIWGEFFEWNSQLREGGGGTNIMYSILKITQLTELDDLFHHGISSLIIWSSCNCISGNHPTYTSLKANTIHTNTMYTNTILYKCYLTPIHLPYSPSIFSHINITSILRPIGPLLM